MFGSSFLVNLEASRLIASNFAPLPPPHQILQIMHTSKENLAVGVVY